MFHYIWLVGIGILAAVLSLAELLGSWACDQIGQCSETVIQRRAVTFLYSVMWPFAQSSSTLGLVAVPPCRVTGVSWTLQSIVSREF